MASVQKLLTPSDPPPFVTHGERGQSPLLIVCDHGGNQVPSRLENLGLDKTITDLQVAWDIGAAQLTRSLAHMLSARAICATYSRLVIDNNRFPHADDSMPALSRGIHVPGNEAIARSSGVARIREVFDSYHNAIRAELDAIEADGMKPILVSVHSMDPRNPNGTLRPEELAILWSTEQPHPSKQLLEELRKRSSFEIGDNVPYSLDIGVDYTVPEHAISRGRSAVMFEVRNDLLIHTEEATRVEAVLASAIRKIAA